ncbi:MAG: hypothetical protein ACH34U_12820 [Cyanobium sp.]
MAAQQLAISREPGRQLLTALPKSRLLQAIADRLQPLGPLWVAQPRLVE